MTRILRCVYVALLSSLCAFVLAACTTPQAVTPEEDSVAANRQYMSSLSQMSDDLTTRLQSFADAVSRNDTVSMRTQAQNAFAIIDEIRDVDAPEDLVDLKTGYMEACDDLETALNSYLDLYDQVTNETIDRATYDTRIKGIQDEYNSAISKLEETDNQATELQK